MDCLDLQRKRASEPPAQARRAPQHFPHGNTEHDAHLIFPVIVLQWDRRWINGDAIESSRRDTSMARTRGARQLGNAIPLALDERQRAAHAVRTCSASTFRPGRPSADFAGSGWRPIASQRTLPKSILVLAGSTCRLRSCGSARPPKSGPRARRWRGAPTRSAHSRLRSALPGRGGGE